MTSSNIDVNDVEAPRFVTKQKIWDFVRDLASQKGSVELTPVQLEEGRRTGELEASVGTIKPEDILPAVNTLKVTLASSLGDLERLMGVAVQDLAEVRQLGRVEAEKLKRIYAIGTSAATLDALAEVIEEGERDKLEARSVRAIEEANHVAERDRLREIETDDHERSVTRRTQDSLVTMNVHVRERRLKQEDEHRLRERTLADKEIAAAEAVKSAAVLTTELEQQQQAHAEELAKAVTEARESGVKSAQFKHQLAEKDLQSQLKIAEAEKESLRLLCVDRDTELANARELLAAVAKENSQVALGALDASKSNQMIGILSTAFPQQTGPNGKQPRAN